MPFVSADMQDLGRLLSCFLVRADGCYNDFLKTGAGLELWLTFVHVYGGTMVKDSQERKGLPTAAAS